MRKHTLEFPVQHVTEPKGSAKYFVISRWSSLQSEKESSQFFPKTRTFFLLHYYMSKRATSTIEIVKFIILVKRRITNSRL